ncbi:manganese-transporting ATPase 13A1 [Fopius arisanus]|uniref:Manganese-transporting ATPase 13A1 n=1 Tax=Fopius arisanus TaxID=64838 RepID=A0A9R1T9F7_9HYME|nr:PREDICTED: manganese-transporting ATPase 13A1 [Fopius arisanus]
MTESKKPVDDLVQSVSLHNPRGLIFRGYVLPFLTLETIWIYSWLFVYGVEDYFHEGLVGIAAIGVLQIFLCLCCQWSVHIYCFLNCSSTKDPYKATVVKVIPTSNNGSSEIVRLHQKPNKEPWFIFQKTKFCWSKSKKRFEGLQYPVTEYLKTYIDSKGYASEEEVTEAEETYGKNHLDMVIPEAWELFKERATAPFFVFQVFSVSLWCFDAYWYYSIFTLFMLIMFEYMLVRQQMRNMAEIRKMGTKPYMMNVYRNRRWRMMFIDQLVPGDIVSLVRAQSDQLVPCDILLLRGQCVVDESMLTGESVPQMKEPLEEIDLNQNLNIDREHKVHVLFGGTKIVQHTPLSKTTSGLNPTDKGCVGYVLRTGFSTSQGKLLRTILFGVNRVTANNLETFGFILFLLIFAIAAAAYVWINGTADPERSRYKLFLECCLILTSVVPPELPIELSLAVNTSLMALSKLGVYCTEPFRIPFAGKVDFCCFDKTGTLTSDNLVVEGITGIDGDTRMIQAEEAPIESIQVLATCHSLVQLDGGIVGDPLEKATLKAVKWSLTKNEAVVPNKGKARALKIFHRFHFSSSLKRMSVIVGNTLPNSTEVQYMVTVKGAPETLKNMFSSIPDNYEANYLRLSRRGARVLALGYKRLPSSLSSQDLRALSREELERDLLFVGFVIISCPLKLDSSAVIKEIINASHVVVMISGDNPLTACHVSRELHFTKKPTTLILTQEGEKWHWASVDGKTTLALEIGNIEPKGKEIWKNYALCVTGDGLEYLRENNPLLLRKLLPHIVIYARCEPKQKEFIVISLQELGFTTLMCGDGTNDVGALKHAQVGVAILSSPPERIKEEKLNPVSVNASPNNGPRQPMNRQQATNMKIRKLLQEIEEQEQATIVKLGDASIAAPFTSKMSSIMCICHIIKQGRCTLVTTLQMFKILALNALVLAYSQSVLYLSGIKFSDYQATMQSMLLAFCFLFISRSKPLKTLSKQRPLPNIFNLYTILTVLLQFAVHFFCLIYLVREATIYSPPEEKLRSILSTENITDTKSSDLDDDENFEANVVNSVVYVISLALQTCNFAVNYRGVPFMESLTENKALFYSLLVSFGLVIGLACGLIEPIAAQLKIVDFPPEFRSTLIMVLVGNFVAAFAVDRACRWLFGEGKLQKL